jgi:NADPH:quinone reductase-like Zn-dependent oxidoreductase
MKKPKSGHPTMRVWTCRRYGGPERLMMEEAVRPVPKANEVLIRIRATTVSSGDVRLRTQKLPRGFGLLGRLIFGLRGLRQPILGTEFSGIVEEVGDSVTTFGAGDAVIGFADTGLRSHAEYRVMAEGQGIVPKPPNLQFNEAAALCFGGTTALHFLRKADLAAGERILVIGATGAVGSAMVQLAKHFGAVVTGVTSTRNLELAKSLGAAEVVDYSQQDFSSMAVRYDVIADTVGVSSFGCCLPLLNEGGRYLAVAADLLGTLALPRGTKKSIGGPASIKPEAIRELAELAGTRVFQPLIHEVFSFDRMREAHALVETGHKRGSVVVSVSSESKGGCKSDTEVASIRNELAKELDQSGKDAKRWFREAWYHLC